ncbi:hypothetical protein EMIT036CA2_50415 [Chryseobacterium sp. IT-36CA2]
MYLCNRKNEVNIVTDDTLGA